MSERLLIPEGFNVFQNINIYLEEIVESIIDEPTVEQIIGRKYSPRFEKFRKKVREIREEEFLDFVVWNYVKKVDKPI